MQFPDASNGRCRHNFLPKYIMPHHRECQKLHLISKKSRNSPICLKVITVLDNNMRYFKVSAVNIVGEGDLSDEFQGQAQEGFTVTFVANAENVGGTIGDINVNPGAVIETAPTGFTKAGEYISSWNTQPDGLGTDFIFGYSRKGYKSKRSS